MSSKKLHAVYVGDYVNSQFVGLILASEELVSQRSGESRRFSPGALVSSHKKC